MGRIRFVVFNADRSRGPSRPSHLDAVLRSLRAVSAICPPSARNIPYFCSALATTRAPWLGSEASG